MNIGLLAKSFQRVAGGIEIYTECLSRSLAALGHTVHIFAAGEDDSTAGIGERVFLHTVRFRAQSFPGEWRLERFVPYDWLAYAWKVRWRVAALPASRRLDVLESPNWGLDGFWTAVFKDLPLVVRLHVPTPDYARTGVMRFAARTKAVLLLERSFVGRADAVTSPSRHLAVRIGGEYGLERAVEVIPNAIETGSAAREAGESPRPTVLYAGRIEKNKGIEVLLKAAAAVLAKVPGTEFILAGRLIEKEASTRRWTAAAPKGVRFIGEIPREKLFGLYRKCWLCVLPSLAEAFGITALEAMTFGKPVVASAAGGLPEIVKDGKTGLLVRPGDHAALERAIVTLLKDAGLRRKMGGSAKRLALRRYGPDTVAAATLRAYDKAIKYFNKSNEPSQGREEQNVWNDIRGIQNGR